MQTLFALSAQSLDAHRARRAGRLDDRAQPGPRLRPRVAVQRALPLKARVAATYVLDSNPELATREKLQELADALEVQYLFTFDLDGKMTATNSNFTNFSLSDDPADQSYEFRKLLQGVDSVVQPAGPDEVSGELRQYIGVTTHDASGTVNGFVQLGIRPTRLETLLDSVQIGSACSTASTWASTASPSR